MKRNLLTTTIAAAMLLLGSTSGQAQEGAACAGGSCLSYNNQAPFGGTTSMMSPVCLASGRQYPRRIHSLQYAAKDHFSPHPVYAYSRNGILAGRTNDWNVAQMQSCPWHGGYSYWRWQAPTALVVPPTAAFQSEYNWGVGQTRSLPIYHQFGAGDAGLIGGGFGQTFPPTPYWPSSTSQFGIYPVRGPWH